MLWLGYLSYSFRRSTTTEQGEVFCAVNRGANRRARHGRSEDQRAYHQAKEKRCFIVSRLTNPIAIRKLTQDGPDSFANTWTNWQEKTTHTLPHGRKERDTRKHGRWVWTAKETPTAPNQSRPDFPQALDKFREMNKEAVEAGHQVAPIIPCRWRLRLGIIGGNLPIPGRHLPNSWWSYTGWQERWVLAFETVAYMRSDSHVSDGQCKQDTAPRTLCTRNIFSRATKQAQDCVPDSMWRQIHLQLATFFMQHSLHSLLAQCVQWHHAHAWLKTLFICVSWKTRHLCAPCLTPSSTLHRPQTHLRHFLGCLGL